MRFYRIDQIPPGLHYDEAFNNLLALRLPQWEPFPPFFFDVEFGRSVLHPYLIALLFQITGPIVLGGRLVSALAGTLTVPLLSFTVWEMFREEAGKRRAAALALTSALSLALLYWHVHLSRIGMEYVMVPALAVPAFGAAIVACVALLAVAPLAHFFLTHPYWLTSRAGQVVRGDLLTGIAKTVGGLFLQGYGDLNQRQNLPGRPALDAIQTALFLLGLGTCAARRRPPHLFLLCWLGVMLLPSALTDYPPHFGRMLGAAPAVAALAGLGTVTFYDLSQAIAARWLPRARRMGSAASALLLSVAFALTGIRTARDYFVAWEQSSDLFIAFDVGLRWIGEQIAALPPEERVYVSPTDRFWKTLEFLLDGDPFRTHNYNGRRCVVYPAVTDTPTTHMIVVLEDPNSLPALQAAFPDGRVVQELYMGDTRYAVAYRTPAGSAARISPARELGADWGQIRLLGYDPPAGPFAPGDTIPLRLYWQSLARMDERYKMFVHLWDAASGEIWGQEDAHPCDNSYYTPWWAVGDVVVNEHRIPINPETPPGEYQLLAGLYREDGPRLPVLGTDSDYVVVTTVQVAAP
ncbi:MAG: hypothetical protein B6I35_01145 [Anaerolineaceae bacterium 4572_32.2]|nr:MAG: hypothetical protein B6I35_01145 [Anaerolineaceae bacterium 4572_32.2]